LSTLISKINQFYFGVCENERAKDAFARPGGAKALSRHCGYDAAGIAPTMPDRTERSASAKRFKKFGREIKSNPPANGGVVPPLKGICTGFAQKGAPNNLDSVRRTAISKELRIQSMDALSVCVMVRCILPPQAGNTI
jgi:hypothetical protein